MTAREISCFKVSFFVYAIGYFMVVILFGVLF